MHFVFNLSKIGLLFCLCSGQVFSSHAERLEQLLPMCQSCHGPQGVSAMPDIPSLAGQHEEYLAQSLSEYRSSISSSPLMGGMALTLQDADVRLLANYYARQPYVRNRQDVDPLRVVRGYKSYAKLCQACHRDGGASSNFAEIPLLAGQNIGFLSLTMKKILGGERKVDSVKRQMLDRVSHEEIEDALHFFSAYHPKPGEVTTFVTKTEPKKGRRSPTTSR